MKTFLKIFLLLMIPVLGIAQDEDDNPEAMEQRDPKAGEKIRAARAAYITERLGLTSEEAEKFWPVYHEYSQKRIRLRQQLRDTRKSGKDEKELLDLEIKIKQEELDLEKDYYGRFQKLITPQKVVQLRQAEIDFRRLLLRQIHQRQQRRQRLQDQPRN